MTTRFRIAVIAAISLISLTAHAEFNPAVPRDPVLRPYVVDTTASWYRPERIYYMPWGKYTAGDFFNALDLPTVFGWSFNPNGNLKGGYYGQMFLEWRHYKTYGAFAIVGLDTYNQGFDWTSGPAFPTGWTNPALTFSWGKDLAGNKLQNADMNVLSGTLYNTALFAGAGYRIPLVKDIKDYYQHPYVCKLNLALFAQLGYNWAVLNNIQTSSAAGTYNISEINYLYPAMKFGTMLEYLVGPMFSIFLDVTYTQNLVTMPWDNPANHAGTLGLSVGFTGFFN